jgi:predicted nucleotidyltransferase
MAQEQFVTNVKNYIRFLKKNRLDVSQAYIFGSYARGNAHEDSDIDVAVVLTNLEEGLFTQFQLMKLRRDFDLRIEPHPFDEIDFNDSNPFANEIISTGIRVL